MGRNTREEWRKIVGLHPILSGFYEVSSLGRVRSLPRCDSIGRTVPGKVLIQALGHDRYRRVKLRVCDTIQVRTVHHLVLEAFVGPRPKGYHACHDDGDSHNNALLNLKWATPAENIADCFRHGTAAGARNFNGATGGVCADGTPSKAMARYQSSRRKRTPEEQRLANAAKQRKHRAKLAVAVVWADTHQP